MRSLDGGAPTRHPLGAGLRGAAGAESQGSIAIMEDDVTSRTLWHGSLASGGSVPGVRAW